MAIHALHIGEYKIDDGAEHCFSPASLEAVRKLFITLALQGGSPSVYQWDEATQCYEFSESLTEKCQEAVSDRLHRRRLGRPKELQGDYETISVAIRKDLLAKIDASGKSRREYIEELLSK